MEETDPLSATRPAASRTSQACQRCRSLKTRCLPSSQSGTCQRCFGAGKDCVWADASRRARKLRAPSRIAQVEQKIDDFVAKLSSAVDNGLGSNLASTEPPPAPEIRQGAVAPGSWMPLPSFEPQTPRSENDIEKESGEAEADRHYLDSIRSVHRFDDHKDTDQASGGFFRPSRSPETPIENELVKQLLASGEADILLEEYRRMSATFPFVIAPQGITSTELYSDRPMLFLAMATAASWKDHSRQMKLDGIYRTELANRTIIRPHRTLGLVQSVLVYLSWYHFVFSHKTQQIFFLHHLVIGLALDIGLHQDYQPFNLPGPRRPKPPPPLPRDLRERHRAFLGCYYLASMIAAGLQKPNLLKHTPQMDDWAQELGRDREYASDEIISHLISLRHIDDQIQDTLFTADAMQLPLSNARTIMHVRFMDSQLDAWKRNSVGATSPRLLELSLSFTRMLLHSVALRPQPSDQPICADSSQLNALLSAFESGKQFLDTLLLFPAHEYHLISFSEWMRLPTVIMTIARLCMPTDAHVAAGWNVKDAQDRVRLDLCLESFCYRMLSLSTYDKHKQSHPDFWHAMRLIVDVTKTWYLRKIGLKQPTQTPSEPTSCVSTGNNPLELSIADLSTQTSHSNQRIDQRYNTLVDIDYVGDIAVDADGGNMDMGMGCEYNNYDNPLAFMGNADFDMELFYDMGIWGDEGYTSMGFGNGASF